MLMLLRMYRSDVTENDVTGAMLEASRLGTTVFKTFASGGGVVLSRTVGLG